MNKHPMQKIAVIDGCPRFVTNEIVRFLVSAYPGGLNALTEMNFHDPDWSQLAQLIGYSTSGYGELSYANRKHVVKADKTAEYWIYKKREAQP